MGETRISRTIIVIIRYQPRWFLENHLTYREHDAPILQIFLRYWGRGVVIAAIVVVVDNVWQTKVRRERRSRKGGESWRLARRNERVQRRQPGAACVPIRSDALFIARPAFTSTLRLIFMESLPRRSLTSLPRHRLQKNRSKVKKKKK